MKQNKANEIKRNAEQDTKQRIEQTKKRHDRTKIKSNKTKQKTKMCEDSIVNVLQLTIEVL